MKTLLVMSDTHGNGAHVAAAAAQCGADIVVHLGDGVRDVAQLRAQRTVYAVHGNCDISSAEPAERILAVEDVRLLMVHGHRQGVKNSLLRIGLYAAEKAVQLALFGHTHQPCEQFYEGVCLYNPGSLGAPRATYGVITIDGASFKIATRRLGGRA